MVTFWNFLQGDIYQHWAVLFCQGVNNALNRGTGNRLQLVLSSFAAFCTLMKDRHLDFNNKGMLT